MTAGAVNMDQVRSPEAQIDLETVRQKLVQRVHEALDRRERGEVETSVLNANDVLLLREVPPQTLEHLVAEVVRDTIEARAQAQEVLRQSEQEVAADAVTESTSEMEEVVSPGIMEEVEHFEQAAEDLVSIESYTAEIIKWHDQQVAQQERETGAQRNIKLQEASHETQIQGTETMLEVMRSFFHDSSKYAIMASTALYLHSKNIERRTGERKFLDAVPPGDLDVFVYSHDDFIRIADKIRNIARHPNVEKVVVNGPQALPGEGTQRLEAIVTLNIDGQLYEHEIEIFENLSGSHILVDPATQQMTERVDGLQILSLEGLTRQYHRNLEREQRVEREADTIRQALTEDERVTTVVREAFEHWNKTKQWPEGGLFDQLLTGLHMSPEDLALVYGLNGELREAELSGNVAEAAVVRTDLSMKLLSLKSKVYKRRTNLEHLMQARDDQYKQ